MVQTALERKVGVTYAELIAAGPEENPDDLIQSHEKQESYKGMVKRFGKRTLAFIGAPDARELLLVWIDVGHVVMAVHYHFFKHATWYSHATPDKELCSIFDFCPRCPKFKTSPAFKALSKFAKMLFDPNGAGRHLMQPLYTSHGSTVHWPEKLLRTFQKAVLIGFCKLWRELYHRFACYPWRAACIFHPGVQQAIKEEEGQIFWTAPLCHVDPGVGIPIRTALCQELQDLYKDPLQEFIGTMYSRSMATSTFVERIFAPMTAWTSADRSRYTIVGLDAMHHTRVFDDSVQRWWGTLLRDADTASGQTTSGYTRDQTAYVAPTLGKQCGWQCFVRDKIKTPGQMAGLTEQPDRFAEIKKLQQEFSHLPPEEKERWEIFAKQARLRAKGKGSPLDNVLAQQTEPESAGGPWNLSCRRGNLPGEWPLARLAIEEATARMPMAAVASVYQAKYDVLWEECPEFPDTLPDTAPCHKDECCCDLSPIQQHRYNSVKDVLRLSLRHTGLPDHCALCFEFSCDAEVRYVLVAHNQWDYNARCLGPPRGATPLRVDVFHGSWMWIDLIGLI